jgi:hypothetical protein
MQSLIEVLFVLLMALPPSRHDTETRNERAGRMWVTAHAVATVSRNEREALALIVQGWKESKFDRAVVSGKCRPGTCDVGKARSAWQLQEHKRNTVDWDALVGTDPVYVLKSAEWAVFSMRRCRRYDHAFQAQGGGRCESGPRGDERYAMLLDAEQKLRDIRAGRAVRVSWK